MIVIQPEHSRGWASHHDAFDFPGRPHFPVLRAVRDDAVDGRDRGYGAQAAPADLAGVITTVTPESIFFAWGPANERQMWRSNSPIMINLNHHTTALP